MRTRKQLMNITERAVHRLTELLRNQSTDGIKINIVQKGCNGLQYKMDYLKDGSIGKFDEVVQQDSIKLVVDSKAVMFLVGTQMDYVEDELRSEFVFNNPNAKGTCGCGESFHV